MINIEDIDLVNSYFHFTLRENIESILKYGLQARIGAASNMVGDKKRVCLSKGFRGILGIKNSFIYELKKIKICDIEEGYRKYFDIIDFSSKENIKEEDVYKAMARRFKDEVYLIVDAKEGEDFLKEDIHGLIAQYDIKGIENHNIVPQKIQQIVTPIGDSAFDVVKYIYTKLIKKNPEKASLIKDMNREIDGMFKYLNKHNIY